MHGVVLASRPLSVLRAYHSHVGMNGRILASLWIWAMFVSFVFPVAALSAWFCTFCSFSMLVALVVGAHAGQAYSNTVRVYC